MRGVRVGGFKGSLCCLIVECYIGGRGVTKGSLCGLILECYGYTCKLFPHHIFSVWGLGLSNLVTWCINVSWKGGSVSWPKYRSLWPPSGIVRLNIRNLCQDHIWHTMRRRTITNFVSWCMFGGKVCCDPKIYHYGLILKLQLTESQLVTWSIQT